MKKLLLATAIAALSVSAAQAAPQVYGKAFVTLDYQDMDVEGTNTALNSTGSRVGLKGAEALTANTDLVYQLEYGVDVDSSSNDREGNDQFYSRDTYVGLSNKQYGTFVAGRLTTIDDQIQYANQASGGVLGGDDVLASFTAPRANNAFAYFSPNYNGMTFMAMYGLDSDQDLNSLADHDQYGVGVKYEPANQPFKVGATYIGAGDALNTARVNGTYNLNSALTVGGQYQWTDFDQEENENAYMLSAAYKTATPWTVYGQADMVTDAVGINGFDRDRFILGGKYAFNANTTGHVYGAYLTQDLPVSTTQTVSNDGFGIGTGIEYKF
jgi:predicted porin